VDKNSQNQKSNAGSGPERPQPAVEVDLDSVALARVLDEVRNDAVFNPSAYNRTYNRHNR
jgi:hypothetical protein